MEERSGGKPFDDIETIFPKAEADALSRNTTAPGRHWWWVCRGVYDCERLCIPRNDEIVPQGNTRDMIFSITAIIEYLSDFMTLSPGDVILTRTAKGLCHLKPGDEVLAEVEHAGSLRNTIIAEPGKHPRPT